MGIFRSDEMVFGTLVLPGDREVAKYILDVATRQNDIQVIDMNTDVMERPFKRIYDRLDAVEVKLRSVMDLMRASGIHIQSSERQMNAFLNRFILTNPYSMDTVESEVDVVSKVLLSLQKNSKTIKKSFLEILREKIVLQCALHEMGVPLESIRDTRSFTDNLFEEATHFLKPKVGTIARAGLLKKDLRETFRKVMFRATRGNAFVIFNDPRTECLTQREIEFVEDYVVFTLIYRENTDSNRRSVVSSATEKIISAFNCVAYDWPLESEDGVIRLNRVQAQLDELEHAIVASENHFQIECKSLTDHVEYNPDNLSTFTTDTSESAIVQGEIELGINSPSEISPGCSRIVEYILFIQREKLLYANLNCFNGDGALRANCWIPRYQVLSIRNIIQSCAAKYAVAAFLLADEVFEGSGDDLYATLEFHESNAHGKIHDQDARARDVGKTARSILRKPPTLFRPGDLIAPFQTLVNTYGTPRYREMNPATAAVVMFPFLFGIMYGDIGHGLILFAVAAYICYKATDIKAGVSLPFLKDAVPVRYMLLLMGFFSIYAGFMYNDFLSQGIEPAGATLYSSERVPKKVKHNSDLASSAPASFMTLFSSFSSSSSPDNDDGDIDSSENHDNEELSVVNLGNEVDMTVQSPVQFESDIEISPESIVFGFHFEVDIHEFLKSNTDEETVAKFAKFAFRKNEDDINNFLELWRDGNMLDASKFIVENVGKKRLASLKAKFFPNDDFSKYTDFISEGAKQTYAQSVSLFKSAYSQIDKEDNAADFEFGSEGSEEVDETIESDRDDFELQELVRSRRRLSEIANHFSLELPEENIYSLLERMDLDVTDYVYRAELTDAQNVQIKSLITKGKYEEAFKIFCHKLGKRDYDDIQKALKIIREQDENRFMMMKEKASAMFLNMWSAVMVDANMLNDVYFIIARNHLKRDLFVEITSVDLYSELNSKKIDLKTIVASLEFTDSQMVIIEKAIFEGKYLDLLLTVIKSIPSDRMKVIKSALKDIAQNIKSEKTRNAVVIPKIQEERFIDATILEKELINPDFLFNIIYEIARAEIWDSELISFTSISLDDILSALDMDLYDLVSLFKMSSKDVQRMSQYIADGVYVEALHEMIQFLSRKDYKLIKKTIKSLVNAKVLDLGLKTKSITVTRDSNTGHISFDNKILMSNIMYTLIRKNVQKHELLFFSTMDYSMLLENVEIGKEVFFESIVMSETSFAQLKKFIADGNLGFATALIIRDMTAEFIKLASESIREFLVDAVQRIQVEMYYRVGSLRVSGVAISSFALDHPWAAEFMKGDWLNEISFEFASRMLPDDVHFIFGSIDIPNLFATVGLNTASLVKHMDISPNNARWILNKLSQGSYVAVTDYIATLIPRQDFDKVKNALFELVGAEFSRRTFDLLDLLVAFKNDVKQTVTDESLPESVVQAGEDALETSSETPSIAAFEAAANMVNQMTGFTVEEKAVLLEEALEEADIDEALAGLKQDSSSVEDQDFIMTEQMDETIEIDVDMNENEDDKLEDERSILLRSRRLSSSPSVFDDFMRRIEVDPKALSKQYGFSKSEVKQIRELIENGDYTNVSKMILNRVPDEEVARIKKNIKTVAKEEIDKAAAKAADAAKNYAREKIVNASVVSANTAGATSYVPPSKKEIFGRLGVNEEDIKKWVSKDEQKDIAKKLQEGDVVGGINQLYKSVPEDQKQLVKDNMKKLLKEESKKMAAVAKENARIKINEKLSASFDLSLFARNFASISTIASESQSVSIRRLSSGGGQSMVMKKNPNHTYLFGLDPVWKGASNELQYLNSAKMKFAIIVGVFHMIIGIVYKGLNAKHFGRDIDFYFEFIPQLVMMVAFFGYLSFLIILKWIQPITANKPSLISLMINMFMGIPLAENEVMFYGQGAVQSLLLLIGLVCVPLMFIPKPVIIFKRLQDAIARDPTVKGHQKLLSAHSVGVEGGYAPIKNIEDEDDNDIVHQNKGVAVVDVEDASLSSHEDDQAHHGFGDMLIHQMIETIEFALGSVSNTASYLRLWALSLAHNQLSLVFYNMLLKDVAWSPNYSLMTRAILTIVSFSAFMLVTIGVILLMDVLECFLHALRLQWVEFQNKFYKADGVEFRGLNTTKIEQYDLTFIPENA